MPDVALLVVDVQNDFCPGGALPVPRGDSVVPVLNTYIALFQRLGYPVIASRDWHPPQTRHFKPFGGVWPVHCVQGTWGAQFHPNLRLPPDVLIVSKGMDPEQDSYTAFDGIDEQRR
ncbi:MAG: isochorismatase family protein, partial [Dehalococcoidia bacterium]